MMHDGVFLIFILGTLVITMFAGSLIMFVIQYKRKQELNNLETENLAQSHKSIILLTHLEVQEQSFKYFSEEIHDNIGQLLSIVKMQLYNIRSSSYDPEIITKATESTELLGKAITDLRNISHTLNSAFVNNAGLAEAIEKDLAYIRSAKSLKCSLHVTGEDYTLGNERELLIFRIIQEAIANAVKHAAPAAIAIHLDYEPECLAVSIVDDGTGFNMNKKTTGGIGLNNMHVRAGLLNGEIKITSETEKGTTIKFLIPVSKAMPTNDPMAA